jgi:hypothetical protein
MLDRDAAVSETWQTCSATKGVVMRRLLVALTAVGVAAALFVPDAMAQSKKAAKAAQPACLNALVCGPQPVPKMRKPTSQKFMKSAS